MAELGKEIEGEIAQEQDIQVKKLQDGQPSNLKEQDTSHVVHLNSTERHKVEETLEAIEEKLETLKQEITDNDCLESNEELEQPLDDSTTCEKLRKEHVETEMAFRVFTGMKLVDEEVSKELQSLPEETREKRSLERRDLLASLAKELEEGAKLLGKDTKIPAQSRSKRGKQCKISALFSVGILHQCLPYFCSFCITISCSTMHLQQEFLKKAVSGS